MDNPEQSELIRNLTSEPHPQEPRLSAKEISARINTEETDGGIQSYADGFGRTPVQLEGLIAGKTVMDLGSGTGRFSAEVALASIRHPDRPLPTHIDSVNIMYGATDYDKFTEETQIEPLQLPGETPTEAEVRQAWSQARANFKPWDWHDLSEVPDAQYDIILSSFGFPYYSDFQEKIYENQSEYETMQRAGSLIEFGVDSRQIFSQLARVLKADGTMLLKTRFPFTAWKYSPRSQQEIRKFFAELGCNVQIFSSTLNSDPLPNRNSYMQITKQPHDQSD